MMTEEQAKTKWCPFARVPMQNDLGDTPDGAPVGNRRLASAGKYAFCIASGCMAWRWLADKKRGFCGLAGGAEF